MRYLIQTIGIGVLQFCFDVMIFLFMPVILFLLVCILQKSAVGVFDHQVLSTLLQMSVNSTFIGAIFGVIALWLRPPHIIYSTIFALVFNVIVILTGNLEVSGSLPVYILLAHIIFVCLYRLNLWWGK